MTVTSGSCCRWSLVMVGLFLASCAGSTPSAKRRPAVPPVVKVTLTEYRFELPGSLPVGRVVFRFTNRGKENHRPSLLRIPEDFPPVKEEVRNASSRLVLPFAGLNTRVPGSTGTFAVELQEGRRYALVCFVTAPDGQGHAFKGMTWEARAGRGGTVPTSPAATEPIETSTSNPGA